MNTLNYYLGLRPLQDGGCIVIQNVPAKVMMFTMKESVTDVVS